MSGLASWRIFAFCCLLSAICYGQGFLPPTSSTPTAAPVSPGPLLIGSAVPNSLTGRDENGVKRPLLTYKSALELLVVYFLDSNCAENDKHWSKMRRLYDDYKDWKVAFVAVNVGGPGAQDDLTRKMKKAGLPISLLNDQAHSLVTAFGVQNAPELVILDESRNLRYRGPLGKEARSAIEALIGHMSPVPDPEPAEAGGCPVS